MEHTATFCTTRLFIRPSNIFLAHWNSLCDIYIFTADPTTITRSEIFPRLTNVMYVTVVTICSPCRNHKSRSLAKRSITIINLSRDLADSGTETSIRLQGYVILLIINWSKLLSGQCTRKMQQKRDHITWSHVIIITCEMRADQEYFRTK